MAVRGSMADLIARVRFLINDPAGASPTISDQQIQDTLDERRVDVRFEELQPAETPVAGRLVTLDHYSHRGNWEADEALFDGAYNELTPTDANRLVGHWTFGADTSSPVYLVGKTYDVYAAAADLLEAWAAREKASFDFTADGASYHRSQKVANLLELARRHRQQQRPQSIRQVRNDVEV